MDFSGYDIFLCGTSEDEFSVPITDEQIDFVAEAIGKEISDEQKSTSQS